MSLTFTSFDETTIEIPAGADLLSKDFHRRVRIARELDRIGWIAAGG